MTDSATDTVRALEDERYQAMRAGDVAVLDRLCSGRLTYVHSGGQRDDKGSFLAKIAAGDVRYHSIEHSADGFLALGGAVLVTGRMTAQATVGGAVRDIDNSCLAVWGLEDGVWRFVAYQPTPLKR